MGREIQREQMGFCGKDMDLGCDPGSACASCTTWARDLKEKLSTSCKEEVGPVCVQFPLYFIISVHRSFFIVNKGFFFGPGGWCGVVVPREGAG